MPLVSSIRKWIEPRVINEKTKLYVFDLLRLATLVFYPWYRFRFRDLSLSGSCSKKLVVGSGPYYAKGWLNLELNPIFRKDVWYDFRNPLPFRANTFQAVYSAHVFEHLFIGELKWILGECYRVLRPGGLIRICLPCLQKNIEAYLKKDHAFFQWDPEELNPFGDPSLGGKFSRNVLVDGAHKNMYDFQSLKCILEKMGFKEAREVGYRQSRALTPEELISIEPDELSYRRDNSLFVEAVK